MSVAPLIFGHFQVDTDENGSPVLLGRGGMGSTYRALDLHLRKRVVLKIIKEDLLENPTLRKRFYNEARAAAQMEHPNIARVLYLSPPEASPCFFAMEFIDGESLASRIRRHGPMAAGEALLVLRAVADALTALGEHGLVHRDIKPENIMVARAGGAAARVKLIDFGLAKPVEGLVDGFESVHTGEVFIGSLYFASPEQICAREALDPRSDFYSLGATLWHSLTGFPPFTGTGFEVQKAHVFNEPAWEKIAEAPAAVGGLLRRLLAKERSERPANAVELLAEWDAAIAALKEASETETVIAPAIRSAQPLPDAPTQMNTVTDKPAAVAPPPRVEPVLATPPLPAAPIYSVPPNGAGETVPAGVATAGTRRPWMWVISGGALLLLCAVAIFSGMLEDGERPAATVEVTPVPPGATPPPATPAPMLPAATPVVAMQTPVPTGTPSAATPLPAGPATPPPKGLLPPVNLLGAGGKDGMRFLPVPIIGGPTDGQTLFFGEYPVRVKDYARFAKETRRYVSTTTLHQTPEDPVVNVTYEDAQAYCVWLGRQTNRRVRLPTDHEWSCAVGIGQLEEAGEPPVAKDGVVKGYPWGPNFPPPANMGNYGPKIDADKFAETSPVGSFPPNLYGLFDLSGNVWEWCEDWMDPETKKERVQRGGSWFDDEAWFQQSSVRYGVAPTERAEYTGFRCVVEEPAR